jgi:hypothetical protein
LVSAGLFRLLSALPGGVVLLGAVLIGSRLLFLALLLLFFGRTPGFFGLFFLSLGLLSLGILAVFPVVFLAAGRVAALLFLAVAPFVFLGLAFWVLLVARVWAYLFLWPCLVPAAGHGQARPRPKKAGPWRS